MKIKRILISAALAVIASVSTATAATYFVDRSFDPSNQVSGSWATNGGLDDFSVSGNTLLTDLVFWGSYWSGGSVPTVESFELAIWERATSTTKGSLVGSTTLSFSKSDTGYAHNNYAPADMYAFDAVLDSAVALVVGDYWLEIKNTAADGHPFVWERSSDASSIGLFYSPSNPSACSGCGDFAFKLGSNVAPVPLPAAFPLLLAALGGLGFAARRRKAA